MRAPEGREVVIVEAVRTPSGRGHKEKGYYRHTHPNELLGTCYTEVIKRAGIDAAEVEDVIAGCVSQFGEQGLNVARNAWLQQGLPIETPGTTVDRQCGSAQQAVGFAAALIAAGVHDAMIGSGVEHMGHLPFAAVMQTQEEFGLAFPPELMAKHNIVGQGLGAEMIADQWEISRSELDELALRSHRLAHQATEEGRFEREIVPMAVNGDTFVTDQGIRPETSLEALSQLKPAFKPDGKITAGNSSQISDGAPALIPTGSTTPRSGAPRSHRRTVRLASCECEWPHSEGVVNLSSRFSPRVQTARRRTRGLRPDAPRRKVAKPIREPPEWPRARVRSCAH